MGRRIVIDDSDEEEEVRKEAVALPKPVPEDIQENDEDGEEELFGSHSSTKKGNSKRPVEKKEVEPGSRKRRAAAVSATKRLSEIKNDAYFKEQIASTHKTPRNQHKQGGSDDEEEDEDEDEEGSVEEVVQHESKKRKQPSKSSSSSSSSMPSRPSTGRSQRVASARDTERSRTLDKIRRRSDVQRQGLSALDALSSSDEEDQDYAEEDDDDGEYEEEEERNDHHGISSSSSSSSSSGTGKKGRREPSFSLAYSTAASPSRTGQRSSVSVGGGGRSSGRVSGGSAFFRRETLAEPDEGVGYYDDDDDFIVGSDEEREAEERDAELRRQVATPLLSTLSPLPASPYI